MLDSPIEEIKSRLNVTDVLQDYIQLRKAGVNYKAVCPFHSEKSPSFVVSPVKQIWHCFGCGLGGDIFEFIKLIENVEFAQALRILADRAGIELKKPTETELKLIDKKDLLVEINTAAAVYFQRVMWESNSGKDALDYLRQRGLSDMTVKRWQLGFAPDDFHYLENFLSKKYSKRDIEDAGLIIKRDKGAGNRGPGDEYFDRFHGRIMFPIANTHGDIIGFTGRILKPQENTGKYVNTPETAIYNKSEVIYGLHAAKNNIRKENRAVLVEGNMDVISCHQAGFGQTVASSGTAITVQQLSTLQRICENLIFAFDSDTAGTAATKRALESALGLGFNVKIVDLGTAKDPDELIKKGIGIWQKAVETAPHYVEFFFDKLFKQYDPNSVDGKREITKELVPLIYRISDTITTAHFVRKLALGINISEQTIWDLLKKVNLPKVAVKPETAVIKKDRKTNLEDEVIGLSLNLSDGNYLASLKAEDFSEGNREVLRAIIAAKTLNIKNLKAKYPNLATQLDLLSFTAQVRTEQEDISAGEELKKVVVELKRLMLKREMEEISGQMAAAERTKDKSLVEKLGTRFAELSAEMTKLA